MEKRYFLAAEKFAEKYKKRKDILGILIVGSILIREPDKNSDVDMYIIVGKAKTRIRGNIEIDGIEIEYFINPVEQIRAYLKNETGKHTAHMLSHSLTLHKRSPVVDQLIAEAKKVLKQKLPPLAGVKRDLAIYSLDDYKKDFEDAFVRKDWFGTDIIAFAALEECSDILLSHYRAHGEKRKRLLPYLRGIDARFARLYGRAVAAKTPASRYAATTEAISYVEKLIGGPRKKEWELRGPLKL